MSQDFTLSETTPAQDKAIEVLIAGGTTTEAAEAADRSRETISRWINHHPAFIAEMNSRRAERKARMGDAVDALAEQALSNMRSMLEEGDPRATETLLKLVGLDAAKVGPTDPQEVIDAKAAKIQARPEHAPDVDRLLATMDGALSSDGAREMAEAELIAELEAAE